MTTPPTLTEVRAWPAVVSVAQAATALGYSRSGLYEQIRRGEAPVRTLTCGRRVVVVTASLVRILEAA
jgi:hypothetical protein